MVVVDGLGEVTLGPDDVVVTETPRQGWAVASDAGASVALDLTITDAAAARSVVAREVVRLVQEARKAAGLEVTDRITLWWDSADPDVAAAIEEHQRLVADEVLATTRGARSGRTRGDAGRGADLPADLAVSRA